MFCPACSSLAESKGKLIRFDVEDGARTAAEVTNTRHTTREDNGEGEKKERSNGKDTGTG